MASNKQNENETNIDGNVEHQDEVKKVEEQEVEGSTSKIVQNFYNRLSPKKLNFFKNKRGTNILSVAEKAEFNDVFNINVPAYKNLRGNQKRESIIDSMSGVKPSISSSDEILMGLMMLNNVEDNISTNGNKNKDGEREYALEEVNQILETFENLPKENTDRRHFAQLLNIVKKANLKDTQKEEVRKRINSINKFEADISRNDDKDESYEIKVENIEEKGLGEEETKLKIIEMTAVHYKNSITDEEMAYKLYELILEDDGKVDAKEKAALEKAGVYDILKKNKHVSAEVRKDIKENQSPEEKKKHSHAMANKRSQAPTP